MLPFGPPGGWKLPKRGTTPVTRFGVTSTGTTVMIAVPPTPPTLAMNRMLPVPPRNDPEIEMRSPGAPIWGVTRLIVCASAGPARSAAHARTNRGRRRAVCMRGVSHRQRETAQRRSRTLGSPQAVRDSDPVRVDDDPDHRDRDVQGAARNRKIPRDVARCVDREGRREESERLLQIHADEAVEIGQARRRGRRSERERRGRGRGGVLEREREVRVARDGRAARDL